MIEAYTELFVEQAAGGARQALRAWGRQTPFTPRPTTA
jgi:hypothetical protein